MRLLVFGDNREGQLGVSYHEDNTVRYRDDLTTVELVPTTDGAEASSNDASVLGSLCKAITYPNEVLHVDCSSVSRVSCSRHNTFVILRNGVLLTCGANDNNELGRSGKRSWLHRVDAIETFQARDVSLGDGFATIICDDGKLLSWGKNELGQLGNGTRDGKEKPRVNSSIQDSFLQVACGGTHTVSLTKSGRVLTWGGNSKGQLGDGQLTSSTTPLSALQLRHRPVVSVSCGENHCLALTIGGNVYAWGDNSFGQLGLMDAKNRLRPEQIKSMRSIGARSISAGRNHSLVVSHSGLLLSFGSNSHGQLGLDSEAKVQMQPQVVERLREFFTINAVGGFSHTLALVVLHRCSHAGQSVGDLRTLLLDGAVSAPPPIDGAVSVDGIIPKIFVMGLNSSGQLGLANTSNQPFPTLLQLDLLSSSSSSSSLEHPIGIYTGPLSMHSLVLTGPSTRAAIAATQQELPSVDYDKIAKCIEGFKSKKKSSSSSSSSSLQQQLSAARTVVADAFSSISVMNASFLLDPALLGHGTLCIDLKAVRSAYDLIASTEPIEPLIMVTLGRATLHLAEQLRECPFDDAENLSVFLIVLENPLMLRPSSFHVAIETVIRAILGIPKYYRIILFKWLKSYPSEYFSRVLEVLQGFLSFALSSRSLALDATPVVMVLETLYQCNAEESIVPEARFYHDAVLMRTVNIFDEWVKYRQQGQQSAVFNYCSYPFLFHDRHKLLLIQFEFQNQQYQQKVHCHQLYPIEQYANAHRNAMEQLLRRGQLPPPLQLPADQLHNYVTGGADALFAAATAVASSNVKLPSGLSVHYEAAEVSGPSQTTATTATTTVAACQLWFELRISRDNLLEDLLTSLQNTLLDDPAVLRLPLRVVFKNEMGQDYGGLKRELFSLAIREITKVPEVFAPCHNQRMVWFRSRTTKEHRGSTGPPSNHAKGRRTQQRYHHYSIEYYFGLLVGLAAFNGVHVDLPLPPAVYKLLRSEQLTLSDLYAVDPELAAGLQHVLQFEDGAGPIEEVFGVTFTASANPLIAPAENEVVSTVDLIEKGSKVFVQRSNRLLFVNSFIRHALHLSAAASVADFKEGLELLFNGPAVMMCSTGELEHILCGSKEIGDLTELRMSTTYKGSFTGESSIVQWLWTALSSLSIADKRRFLHFVTGTESIPLGGLSAIHLVVQSVVQAETALPTAHTCFNTLNIPDSYPSLAHLRERLSLALQHHHGFGLV